MTSDLGTRPAPAAVPEESLKIVPARHPATWVAAAIVAVLVAMAGHALVTNEAFDWPTFGRFVFQKSILEAVALTLELTLFGVIAGFVLGTVLALMRISRNPLLRAVSWTYTWIFRSVPLILQLLFWYNLAILYNEISFGVPFGPSFVSVGTMSLIPPFLAAGLGLALHQGAYAAEIVRASPGPSGGGPGAERSTAVQPEAWLSAYGALTSTPRWSGTCWCGTSTRGRRRHCGPSAAARTSSAAGSRPTRSGCSASSPTGSRDTTWNW